jgi:hypothetical protein
MSAHIKEQGWGRNWGSDEVMVVYPDVSSCMTLTLFYESQGDYDTGLLVGLHLGLFTPTGPATGAPVTGADVDKWLLEMASVVPTRPAKYAFMIGQFEVWGPLQHILRSLNEYAKWELGRNLMDDEYSDISDLHSATIKVVVTGVVNIQTPEGEKRKFTFNTLNNDPLNRTLINGNVHHVAPLVHGWFV